MPICSDYMYTTRICNKGGGGEGVGIGNVLVIILEGKEGRREGGREGEREGGREGEKDTTDE